MPPGLGMGVGVLQPWPGHLRTLFLSLGSLKGFTPARSLAHLALNDVSLQALPGERGQSSAFLRGPGAQPSPVPALLPHHPASSHTLSWSRSACANPGDPGAPENLLKSLPREWARPCWQLAPGTMGHLATTDLTLFPLQVLSFWSSWNSWIWGEATIWKCWCGEGGAVMGGAGPGRAREPWPSPCPASSCSLTHGSPAQPAGAVAGPEPAIGPAPVSEGGCHPTLVLSLP